MCSAAVVRETAQMGCEERGAIAEERNEQEADQVGGSLRAVSWFCCLGTGRLRHVAGSNNWFCGGGASSPRLLFLRFGGLRAPGHQPATRLGRKQLYSSPFLQT